MASGQTPAKKAFKSRKKSLRFYRSQKQAPPPSFLSKDAGEDEKENERETTSIAGHTAIEPSADKPLVIIMSKKSIFLFFFIVALVAVLCFAAGFLVSYLSFGPKPQTVISKKAPAPDGKTPKTAAMPDTVVAPVSFSLELATSDDLETAQQMVKQLKEQKLIPFIHTTQDATGRTIYQIRAGQYGNYTSAHSALKKLPQPFSIWGKVVKMEHHATHP